MWVAHFPFSVGDALSNAPISIVSSWHRTSRSADANRGSPSDVFWMPRCRSVGIDKRLGRVVWTESSLLLPSVRVSLGDGAWREELCHVFTHGKARAMRVMERDFRLGSARAMPTTVRSLLNHVSIWKSTGMTHEGNSQ